MFVNAGDRQPQEPVTRAWRKLVRITPSEAKLCLLAVQRRHPKILPRQMVPVQEFTTSARTGKQIPFTRMVPDPSVDWLIEPFSIAIMMLEQHFHRLPELPRSGLELNTDYFEALAKAIGAPSMHVANMLMPAGIVLDVPHKFIDDRGTGYHRLAIVDRYTSGGIAFAPTYRDIAAGTRLLRESDNEIIRPDREVTTYNLDRNRALAVSQNEREAYFDGAPSHGARGRPPPSAPRASSPVGAPRASTRNGNIRAE
jgi:hypothetical protein